jgi:hypothetical protein
MSVDETSGKIISNVERGKVEFAIPAYASAMKWVAPRMPFLIGIIHNRIVKIFKELS